MRTFIAIELPPSLQRSLGGEIARLRDLLGDRTVRWVEAKAVHLTLRFLGEIDQPTAASVGISLDEIGSGFGAMDLEVGGLGGFPSLQRPRVIWIGVRASDLRLLELQAAVEASLASLGVEREDRKFHPHLTLGRLRRETPVNDLRRLEEHLPGHQVGVLGGFRAEGVSLMRSELTPAGAVHNRLHYAPLNG